MPRSCCAWRVTQALVRLTPFSIARNLRPIHFHKCKRTGKLAVHYAVSGDLLVHGVDARGACCRLRLWILQSTLSGNEIAIGIGKTFVRRFEGRDLFTIKYLHVIS